jgi:hypothetical protein
MGKTGFARYKFHRELLAAEQNNFCFWCNQKMLPANTKIAGKRVHPLSLTLDHIQRVKGLQRYTSFKVSVAACRKCNNERHIEEEREKHLKRLLDFLDYIIEGRPYSDTTRE